MARSPRSDQFDPNEVSVFHCINRCVRRCFLCGVDPITGAAKRRIDQHRGVDAQAADWLAPLTIDETAAPGPVPASLPTRCSDKGVLPMSLAEYVTLVDWTGRQVADGKSGSIPEHLAPILIRLAIDTDQWLHLCTRFGQLFYRVAASHKSLVDEAHRKGCHWYQAPGSDLLSARQLPSWG